MLERTADVYNLSVGGVHEYFADGVLVSNCDSLRYATKYVERGQHAFKHRPDISDQLFGKDKTGGVPPSKGAGVRFLR